MTECIVRDSKIINRQFFFSRKTVFILRCLTIKLELAYSVFFFLVCNSPLIKVYLLLHLYFVHLKCENYYSKIAQLP